MNLKCAADYSSVSAEPEDPSRARTRHFITIATLSTIIVILFSTSLYLYAIAPPPPPPHVIGAYHHHHHNHHHNQQYSKLQEASDSSVHPAPYIQVHSGGGQPSVVVLAGRRVPVRWIVVGAAAFAMMLVVMAVVVAGLAMRAASLRELRILNETAPVVDLEKDRELEPEQKEQHEQQREEDVEYELEGSNNAKRVAGASLLFAIFISLAYLTHTIIQHRGQLLPPAEEVHEGDTPRPRKPSHHVPTNNEATEEERAKWYTLRPKSPHASPRKGAVNAARDNARNANGLNAGNIAGGVNANNTGGANANNTGGVNANNNAIGNANANNNANNNANAGQTGKKPACARALMFPVDDGKNVFYAGIPQPQNSFAYDNNQPGNGEIPVAGGSNGSSVFTFSAPQSTQNSSAYDNDDDGGIPMVDDENVFTFGGQQASQNTFTFNYPPGNSGLFHFGIEQPKPNGFSKSDGFITKHSATTPYSGRKSQWQPPSHQEPFVQFQTPVKKEVIIENPLLAEDADGGEKRGGRIPTTVKPNQ